jgi:hypothetical protein
MQCRHLDGNALNCRLENLAYGSQAQNEKDKVCHGTAAKGERHSRAKLTDELVRYLCKHCRPGDLTWGFLPLARRLGVASATVTAAVKGKTWRHLRD